MEITAPKLKELDRRVGEFYKLSYTYLNNIGNLYGRGVYKKELSEILDQAEKIKPQSYFDELVLRNIKSNLILHDLTMDYITDLNFSLSVEDFLDRISGKGTFKFLEERVRNHPWEKEWKILEKTEEKDHTRVSPFTKEAQNAARLWIPRLKEDILKYGKKEGLLPNDFDIEVLLIPPKEGEEFSSWNSKTGVFSLGSYTFDFFYKNEKGVVAIPTKAYKAGFHEVLGHGAHQINSQKMPFSCRFTEEIGSITPTKSITEGVALYFEKEVYSFLRSRLEELGISEEDINILQESDELTHQSEWESLYYALLKDKELREKGFNSYEYLLKITQNPFISRVFKEDFKVKFKNLWKYIGHIFGPLHFENMRKKVEEEFGSEYLTKERKKFHRAILTGVWSWEVYPEAVIYILKNLPA